MSKKKKRHTAPNKLVISKEKMWDLQKPRYNGFACGYGVHGKTKYDREESKRDFRKELDNLN